MSVVALLGTTLRLAVPLYLSTLLLSLGPTAVMMLGLGTLAGDRPWRGDLLGPNWFALSSEIVMEAYYGRGLPGLTLVVVGMVLLVPLMMLIQVVVYSFLAGGIMERLRVPTARSEPSYRADDSDAPVGPEQPVSFWAGCRRWFWPFLRLSLLGQVLFVMAGVLAGVVVRLAGSLIGPDIGTIVQFAITAIVLGWLELARAEMVVRSQRSVGRALVRAARGAVRPVVLLVWLALALPSSGVLVAAILPPAVPDPYAPLSLVTALAFGQGVAFLGAWTRVVRLAVALWLAGSAVPAGAARLAPARLA